MDLFDQIWRSVFRKAPTLSQEEVIEVFGEMDALLRGCMALIGGSDLVLRDVMLLTADVVGSLSHGRAIFCRGDAIERVPKDQKERRGTNSLAWNTSPGQTFRYRNQPDTDAIDFMRSSLRFFAAHRDGTVTADDACDVRLSRASHEAIVENFLKTAGPYVELSLQTAHLRVSYLKTKNLDRMNRLISQISENSERMFEIEDQVGMSDELYGVVVDLRHRWAQYRRLREKVYIPYLRVVFDEAKRRSTSSIQTLENFQNGAVSLMNAVSNYNPRRGVFSSYARMWGQQNILHKLKEEANPIKLPAAIWQMANKLNGIAQRHASASIDGSFDLALVAEEAGIDKKRAEKVFKHIRSTQMLSIDYQNADDPDAQTLHETLEDSVPDEVPDVTEHLAVLPERQRVYVLLHFGLLDLLPGSVPADQVALAKERLRQRIAEVVNN